MTSIVIKLLGGASLHPIMSPQLYAVFYHPSIFFWVLTNECDDTLIAGCSQADVQWLLIECGGLGPGGIVSYVPPPPIRGNQNRSVDRLPEHAECLSPPQGPVEGMMDLR